MSASHFSGTIEQGLRMARIAYLEGLIIDLEEVAFAS